MKTGKYLLGCTLAIALLFASCDRMINKGSKGSVRDAYFEWVEEVEHADGNPQKVIALYAKDAILLPTLSPRIYTSRETITGYFEHFLQLKDLEVDTEKLITREYGNIAMSTGFYSFYHKSDKNKEVLHVRFDFWYKKVDGKWKIIFHQSSILPSGK